MIITRVTVGSAAYAGVQNVQQSAVRMVDLQNKLSSGKRISTPSDDPAGTVQAMQLRGALVRNQQYAANAADAQSWLNTIDDAYSSTVTTLQRARTLVQRGLNTGATDATANGALASEMDTLKTQMLQLANANFNGRPVFGGTTASPVAYDTSGNYVGDGGVVTRDVGEGITVPVSTNGPSVFGSGSSDVFQLVQQAADALRTNPAGMSGMLANFDDAIARVSAAQASEGARANQVQDAQSALTTRSTGLQSELSGVEDVDLADMAMKVATANTNYQAALQTTAKISQLSLMDFLR
jgi:flagellar hook-associated protein 3 FlgL